MEKDKRIILYEDENCILERRSNRYYLGLYDDNGTFLREVVINLKENGKITVGQVV